MWDAKDPVKHNVDDHKTLHGHIVHFVALQHLVVVSIIPLGPSGSLGLLTNYVDDRKMLHHHTVHTVLL